MDKSRCYFYLHVNRNNERDKTIWINKMKSNFILNETRILSYYICILFLNWRSQLIILFYLFLYLLFYFMFDFKYFEFMFWIRRWKNNFDFWKFIIILNKFLKMKKFKMKQVYSNSVAVLILMFVSWSVSACVHLLMSA